MVEEKNVCGSAAQAKPLIIGKTTVYVHSNIQEVLDEETKEPTGLYTYDEIRYTKDEYLTLMANTTETLGANVDFLLLMNQITMGAAMAPSPEIPAESDQTSETDETSDPNSESPQQVE